MRRSRSLRGLGVRLLIGVGSVAGALLWFLGWVSHVETASGLINSEGLIARTVGAMSRAQLASIMLLCGIALGVWVAREILVFHYAEKVNDLDEQISARKAEAIGALEQRDNLEKRVAELSAQVSADSPTPALAIEYVEGTEPFVMEWPHLKRLVQGTEISYTQRTYRVRVRNSSTKTITGAKVMLTRVSGVEAKHASVLADHHLRVMEKNTEETVIHPGSSVCFDVVAHELDAESNQVIDELSFCYAVGNMPSLPTDPGRWWEFTLRAHAAETPSVESRFRLTVDDNNVARLRQVGPAPTTGVEASYEARKPFEDDDYVDTEFGRGGRVFRVGLRSRDERTHVVRVYIDALEGGIEGQPLDRLMRFKDVEGGIAQVPPDSKACVFVDVLKYPTMGQGAPTLLYDKKPAYGDTVMLKSPFSITLRIVGGPKTEYMTLHFVPDILGLPHVLKYEVRSG